MPAPYPNPILGVFDAISGYESHLGFGPLRGGAWTQTSTTWRECRCDPGSNSYNTVLTANGNGYVRPTYELMWSVHMLPSRTMQNVTVTTLNRLHADPAGAAGTGQVFYPEDVGSEVFTVADGAGVHTAIPWNPANPITIKTYVDSRTVILSRSISSGYVAGTALPVHVDGGRAKALAGGYDAQWQAYGQNMANLGRPNDIVRIGWEFNQGDPDWNPQTAARTKDDGFNWNGNNRGWSAANFKAYYQRIIDNIHVHMPGARFIFCPGIATQKLYQDNTQGGTGNIVSPAAYYPGDGYIDYVGLDMYDMLFPYPTTSGAKDPAKAWSFFQNLGYPDDSVRPYSMNWLATFAALHAKPIIFGEWGMGFSGAAANNGGDSAAFITNMHAWCRNEGAYAGAGHDVYEASFFPPNPDNFTTGAWPNAFAAMQTVWDDMSGPALTISTASLPPSDEDVAYPATQMTATGGTSPYTWTQTGLDAPGLNLAISSSGLITGTPTVPDTYPVTITVTDHDGTIVSRAYTITIRPVAVYVPPSIVTASLPDGQVSQNYSVLLQASDGTGSYTWTATGLPAAGLSISTSGAISGVPTTAGTLSITVTLFDGFSTVTHDYTILIAPAPPQITTPSLPDGQEGDVYTVDIDADFGTLPYTWTASGLPAGLTFDTSTAVISGTPTVAGTFTINVTVTDGIGGTDSTDFPLTVLPTGLQISTRTLPGGYVGEVYTATLAGIGGIVPYHWTATNIPTGLTLNGTSGVLSGTPTVAAVFAVVVTLTDSDSPATVVQRQIMVSIGAAYVPPTITTTTLPTAYVGLPYAALPAVTDGRPPYVWTASGLPAGLTIDPDSGKISGTPTTVTTATVTLTVTDQTGGTDSATLTLDVQPGPAAVESGGVVRLMVNADPQGREYEDLVLMLLEPSGEAAPPPAPTPTIAVMGLSYLGDGSVMGPQGLVPNPDPPPVDPPLPPDFAVAVMGHSFLGDGSVMGPNT